MSGIYGKYITEGLFKKEIENLRDNIQRTKKDCQNFKKWMEDRKKKKDEAMKTNEEKAYDKLIAFLKNPDIGWNKYIEYSLIAKFDIDFGPFLEKILSKNKSEIGLLKDILRDSNSSLKEIEFSDKSLNNNKKYIILNDNNTEFIICEVESKKIYSININFDKSGTIINTETSFVFFEVEPGFKSYSKSSFISNLDINKLKNIDKEKGYYLFSKPEPGVSVKKLDDKR